MRMLSVAVLVCALLRPATAETIKAAWIPIADSRVSVGVGSYDDPYVKGKSLMEFAQIKVGELAWIDAHLGFFYLNTDSNRSRPLISFTCSLGELMGTPSWLPLDAGWYAAMGNYSASGLVFGILGFQW